jgi:Cupin domain
MLAVVPPQGGPPPHTHSNADETFYVLDGTPTFRLDQQIVIAGPGDFINIPKGTLQDFRNLSEEPMRMILTFTPAGIEQFFEETLERAYDLTQDCHANLAGVGARYAQAGSRYAIEFFPTPERHRPPVPSLKGRCASCERSRARECTTSRW